VEALLGILCDEDQGRSKSTRDSINVGSSDAAGGMTLESTSIGASRVVPTYVDSTPHGSGSGSGSSPPPSDANDEVPLPLPLPLPLPVVRLPVLPLWLLTNPSEEVLAWYTGS